MDKHWFSIVLVVVSVAAEEGPLARQEVAPQAFSYAHVIHDHGPSVRHPVPAEGEQRTYGHHDTVVQTINKPVPYTVLQPYAVTVEKHVPYAVRVPVAVPVDHPYPVHIAKPYAVPVERPVPVPVERPVPVPVKYPVRISVPTPVPYAVPHPYPVFIHGHGSPHHYEHYDQPQYDQPQYNQPQYDQPQYKQPQYDDGGSTPEQSNSAEEEEKS